MRSDLTQTRPELQLIFFVGLLFLLVLGAFFLLEQQGLQATSRLFERQHTAGAIFLLVILGLALDVFLPLPATLIAATAAATLGASWGFAAVWLGLNAGCLLGYEFGATAGHATLSRMLKDSHRRRMKWLESRLGLGALLVCRPVPVLAEVSVLFAGSTRVARRTFYPLCLVANALVAGLYVWAIPTTGG